MLLSPYLLFALLLFTPAIQVPADEALLAAARKGDVADVKRLLAAGALADARDKQGATALMLAAKGGHTLVVRELLTAKADPNAKDAKGLPVLNYSGGLEQPSVVTELAAGGARMDERGPDGDTLLLKAAAGGDADLVAALLSNGANPNLRDKDGNTPLIRCAWWTQYDVIFIGKEERHAQVVGELIARGADANVRGKDGVTALMRAAGWQHSPTLKALLKGGADPNIRDNKGRTALTWAARNTYRRDDYIGPLLAKGAKLGVTDALLMGDLKKARELTAKGGDVSVRGGYEDTPLMIAAEWGDLQTVNALLQRKVEVNARDSEGYTAVMIAAAGRPGFGQIGRYWTDHDVKKGRGAVIRALVRAGANLELRAQAWSKDTALSLAIEAKNSESALALIEAGAKPDSGVEIYGSLMQLAAGKGEDAVVLALLKAGAVVKVSSPDHCVLGTAASTCKPNTVRALLKAGAPVNVADRAGVTSLMSAAWQGKLENARILLDAGAQINRRSKDGNTALGLALDMAPSSGVAQLLLKRGARVGLIESLLNGKRALALAMIRSGAELNAVSQRGYTPLMIACEWGDLELVRALLNRRAKITPRGRISESPLVLAACGRDELVDVPGQAYRYRTNWIDHGKRGKARIPIIKELLARGAKVDQADSLGQTALERASAKGDLEIMTFLMDSGAEPNYAPPAREFGDGSRFPLISAASEGHLPAVELLVARGARVNGGSGEYRRTALSAAVSGEHVEVVRFLLCKGADPNIRDWDGWPLIQKAKERKNQAVVDLLSGASPVKK